MDLEEKLEKYLELEEEIFKEFGYEQTWHRYPIQVETDSYWLVTGLYNEVYVYSPKPFSKKSIESGKEISSATIQGLSTGMWKTETHTMVLLDTHVDGNIWLFVFDNEKECKDKKLASLCEEWGCG